MGRRHSSNKTLLFLISVLHDGMWLTGLAKAELQIHWFFCGAYKSFCCWGSYTVCVFLLAALR